MMAFKKAYLSLTENQISKGEKFEKEAEEKINGWWAIFGSNYRDAARLYIDAVECYKLAKSWDKAAAGCLKQAGCYLKLDESYKECAAYAYEDAANCYKKISAKDAISCFDRAVNQSTEIGKFSKSASLCKEIGELCEVEQNTEKAIVYFERAVDLCQSEKFFSYSNKCNKWKQKIAQLSAQLEQYPRAIEIYEDVAKESLKKDLLKYDVKGCLLNAGLCELCKANAVAISNALERYEELDPTFSGTREYNFLADLAASVDEVDVQKFTDVVKKSDSMTKLDAWQTTLLMRIKEKLKAKEMEENDLT